MSSSVLTFYAIPYCPFCFRVRYVLNYHGIAYEEKLVQPLGKANAPAWFLALNPLGEVPVIVDNGKPVVDSATIAKYIDEKLAPVGAKKIFPTEEKEKIALEEAIKKVSAIMPLLMGLVVAMGPAVAEAKEKLNAALVQLFANDFHGPYVIGNSLTYADVILYQLSVYFDVIKFYKNWSFPDHDEQAKAAAKKFSAFVALVSSSDAAQKIKFADHQKFLDTYERRARPGPISTFILTHTAFRNHLKSLLSASPATSHSAEFSQAVAQFLEQFAHHARLEDSLLFPAIDAKEHEPTSKLFSQEQKDYQYQTKILDVPKEGHKKLHELEELLKHSLKENKSVKEILEQLKVYGEAAVNHLGEEEKVMSPLVNKWIWEQQAVIVRYGLYAYDLYAKHGSISYLLYVLNHLSTAAERQQVVKNVKFSLQHAETHEAKDEEKLKELFGQLKQHSSAEVQQHILPLL